LIIYKKSWCLILIAVLSSVFTPDVYAQSEDVHVTTEIEYAFADKARFVSQLLSPEPIENVILFTRSESSQVTQAITAILDRSEGEITAEVRLNLDEVKWQPFSPITYWWQIEFEDGETTTTPPELFNYIDNREFWSFLEVTQIRIHWQIGDLEFGQAVVDISEKALDSILDDLALPARDLVNIYIYPTVSDLQETLQLGGSSWIRGHSFDNFGVILLAASPDSEGIVQLERDIPHELTHALLAQRLGASYDQLPAWFNEGLATLEEAAPSSLYPAALENAYQANKLLPMASLCASFPFDNDQALLAYAQSASFVKYIKDIYGIGAFVALFDAYQEGTSCEGGVQRVFQRPLTQLEAEWIDYHFSDQANLGLNSSSLLWALPIILFLFGGGYLYYRHRKGKAQSGI
jgi:hypothetical protein